jgi:hypothetical protein
LMIRFPFLCSQGGTQNPGQVKPNRKERFSKASLSQHAGASAFERL